MLGRKPKKLKAATVYLHDRINNVTEIIYYHQYERRRHEALKDIFNTVTDSPQLEDTLCVYCYTYQANRKFHAVILNTRFNQAGLDKFKAHLQNTHKNLKLFFVRLS